MSNSPAPDRRDFERPVYVGLLGLAVAVVIQLQERDVLDWPQWVAVYCFGAAIPLLTISLLSDYARRSGLNVPKSRDALGFFAAALAVVGLGSLFLHFGIAVGVLFFVFSFFSFVLNRML